MSKRLQVTLGEPQLREIQRAARAQRMTVAEWVRQALRNALRRDPVSSVGRKTKAIRAAVRHSFPTADIEQMLSEIESGYLGPGGS